MGKWNFADFWTGASSVEFVQSPAPPVARILHQIPVLAGLADVVFLVVAVAFGGVEGRVGRAARALVALVVVGNGIDGFVRGFAMGFSVHRGGRTWNAAPSNAAPSFRGTPRVSHQQNCCPASNDRSWLWVPGSRVARPGTTVANFRCLQFLLTRGRSALGLLAVLLFRAMAAVETAGRGAEHAVVAGIVTGDAADHGAFQAAFGVGRTGGQRQRGDGEHYG